MAHRARSSPDEASFDLVNEKEPTATSVMSLRQLYPACDGDVDLTSVYAFPERSGTWVRAVFVSSIDGAATLEGRAGGLGNSTDHDIFSLLRGLADVVLVGARTAEIERYGPIEPSPLWADQRLGRPPTPPLAIVSRSLSFDLTGPLFTATTESARTIVVTCEAAPNARLRDVRRVADVIVAGDERVEPPAALEALAQRGHRRVSCEGGPQLLSEIAQAGCLDELCLTLSPILLGGASSRITDGPAMTCRLGLDLTAVMEDESSLFLTYVRSGSRAAG